LTWSRMKLADIPRSTRWSAVAVLVGLALLLIVMPLTGQSPERPVQLEKVVVGWTGLIALVGLGVQWGMQIAERAGQKRDQDRIDAALASLADDKMDRREMGETLRRLDEFGDRLDATNSRLDRFLKLKPGD
jgi:hypothetical protein